MRVALMTFTRDRLDYTKHCFASLEENAGCGFDQFVLDNDSTDGTQDWLRAHSSHSDRRYSYFSDENIGICRSANKLLDILGPEQYDVVCRFDNDCEVTQPNTLRTIAEAAFDYGAIVSPRVNGLNHPPTPIRTVSLGGQLLDETLILGGIFMAIPAFMFTTLGYRYIETSPLACGDEAIVPWARARGHVCGYLQGWSVNHYETSEGQKARFPEYEARKVLELAGFPPKAQDVFSGDVTVTERVYQR